MNTFRTLHINPTKARSIYNFISHDMTPKYVANEVSIRNSFMVGILNTRRNQENNNTKQNLVTLDNSFAKRAQKCITRYEKILSI